MLQLDPALVRDRLRSTVSAFVMVGVARDWGAVKANTIRWPSAWVLLLGEQAGENRYDSCDFIEQTVTARVAVIMAVRDIADRTGAHAGQDLQSLREAALLSLCRFIPEPGGQAFRFLKGALQSGIDSQGGLFWQDEFTLRFDRRIQIT
jgi:hypothetical protein